MQRYFYLDVLKGILCVLIFLGHAPGFIPCLDNDLVREWNRAFTGGPIVTCWFVMSGFFAWKSLEKRKCTSIEFLLSKLRRFYPTYFVCFLISLIALPIDTLGIIGGGHKHSAIIYVIILFLHLTLTQSIVPVNSTINAYCSTSWYLSCLLFLYLMAVVMYKTINAIIQKIGLKRVFLLWFCMYAIEMLMLSIKYISPLMYELPVFRICEFDGGMLISCLVRVEISENKKIIHWTKILLTIAIWLLSMYIIHFVIRIYGWKYMVAETPFCMMLIYTLSHVQKREKSRYLIPFTYLSQYSMEFFLIHYTVLRFFKLLNISSYFVAVIYCMMAVLLALKFSEIVKVLTHYNKRLEKRE